MCSIRSAISVSIAPTSAVDCCHRPASQTFTYTVVVKDADGDTPAGVRVRTDSGEHVVPTAIADLTYVSA